MIRTAMRVGRTSGPRVLHSVQCAAAFNVQQARPMTAVVERLYKPRLAKKGELPRLKNRNMVYRLVENVRDRPASDLECILLDYVEGVGAKGAVVKVSRAMFRNKLYPAGLATYSTPENLKQFASVTEEESEGVTAYAKLTQSQLAAMCLRVPMSGQQPWTLNKTHLRVAFRKMGVELQESCLELPAEPVTEPGEIQVTVRINKVLPVQVRALVYHLDPTDPSSPVPSQQQELPPFPRVFRPSVRRRHKGEHSPEDSEAAPQ